VVFLRICLSFRFGDFIGAVVVVEAVVVLWFGVVFFIFGSVVES
jgi:hypothetical protein